MKRPTYRFTAAPIDLGDLRLLGLAIHDAMPERIVFRQHGLEGYLFTLFHAEVTLRVHGVEQRCPPHSLVIWEPGECQRYGNASASWDYSWVNADGSLLHEMLHRLAIPRNAVITLSDPYYVERFLQDVHRELTGYPTPNPTILRNAFSNVLAEVQRQLAPDELSQQLPPWAATIKQYIEGHYAEHLTLAHLADMLHFSNSYFCRQFKKVFGVPVLEYLVQIRMRMAKFFLLDGNLGIEEISHRVGYDSYSNFCAQFKRYYGVNPREMRKGISGEAGRRQRADERRSRELAHWLREGWQLVLESDFTRETALDPRLQVSWHHDYSGPLQAVPHFANFDQGCLCLHADQFWTSLRWDGELAEELKVELVAANRVPEGVNLAIAISGDILDGYRLRIMGYDHIALETVSSGDWQQLYRCPCTLDPRASEYRITFWRSDNVFYAEIDGQRVLEYHEPFAPQGVQHRRFAVGRYFPRGCADLKLLRVFQRTAPRYVDILEPGRQLLRLGYRQDAAAWFRRIAEEHAASPLRHEALYLAALAVPAGEREASDGAFRQAASDATSPYHRRLLRHWAFSRLEGQDTAGAVDIVLTLAHTSPDDDTPRLLADKIITAMQHAPQAEPAAYAQILRELARLPVTDLRFLHLPLGSLAPLRGMPLQHLTCDNAGLTELATVQEMPLQELSVNGNVLAELTALTGMPLRELRCSMNRITDLTPLRGMPLQIFACASNQVRDLAPLSGMPLHRLLCAHNRIDDLTPLRGMPLLLLDCSDNQICDLSSLTGMPLQEFDCSSNQISDLTPLHCTRLKRLNCRRNAISDLSPLAGLPLQCLHCGENPLVGLHPLHGMALEELVIEEVPLNAENLRVLQNLPLRHLVCDFTPAALALVQTHASLEGMNYYDVAYLRTIGERLFRTVRDWQSGAVRDLQLRRHAIACTHAAYLALPIRLSRPEAEAFSRYCGGTLACPATAEEFQTLLDYLATITIPGNTPWYHLGLTRDPDTHALHWLSGAPYQWSLWQHPASDTPPSGIPSFMRQLSHHSACWRWDPNPDTRYDIIIEWR